MTQDFADITITDEQVKAINNRIAAGREYAEHFGDISEDRNEPTGEEAYTMTPDTETQFETEEEAHAEYYRLHPQDEGAYTMNTTTHKPDTDELANELKLYAENTYELYEQRKAIERTTDSRLDAGKPITAKSHAIKCLKGWLDQAAHMYGREIGHHYYPRFTAAAKKQAAEMIAAEIIDEYEYRKPYR